MPQVDGNDQYSLFTGIWEALDEEGLGVWWRGAGC